jgi:hypothetical protein
MEDVLMVGLWGGGRGCWCNAELGLNTFDGHGMVKCLVKKVL